MQVDFLEQELLHTKKSIILVCFCLCYHKQTSSLIKFSLYARFICGYYSSFLLCATIQGSATLYTSMHYMFFKASLPLVFHLIEGGSFYWCIHRSGDIQETPEEGRGVFVIISRSMYLLIHYFYFSGQVNFFVGLYPFLSLNKSSMKQSTIGYIARYRKINHHNTLLLFCGNFYLVQIRCCACINSINISTPVEQKGKFTTASLFNPCS
jgi:hypothetical protein